MARYIWQARDWSSRLRWDEAALLRPLAGARQIQGIILGKASALGLELGREVQVAVLTTEAVTTAAIEGETLDRSAVRSSLARRLGLSTAGLVPSPRNVDGLVDVLLDATTHYDAPLTAARLKSWQAALFPTGHSGLRKIAVGQWRQTRAPMQVVSGPIGRERVHFEAPPSARVATEMRQFLAWWRTSRGQEDGLMRAALAHLHFVTVHPFEDGNGRIARTLTDMALAQDERTAMRLYSLSAQIQAERDAYYNELERTQKGDGDVTSWLVWFLGCFARAVARSEREVEIIFAKARFWQRHGLASLNERQVKALNRLIDAGPDGFEGGLTTKKYAHLTKTSESTAKREVLALRDMGLIVQVPGSAGRNTRYEVNW